MDGISTLTINLNWLVVSTHLKNISQIGNLPQTGVKKKYLKPPPSKPFIVGKYSSTMGLEKV